MIDILEIIKEISAKKREDKVEPTNAMWSDISQALTEKAKKEINQLITDKKLIFHRTINSFSFEVAEDQQNNNT